jgi:hypothetical protein
MELGTLNMTAEYVDRISAGDIPETITDAVSDYTQKSQPGRAILRQHNQHNIQEV